MINLSPTFIKVKKCPHYDKAVPYLNLSIYKGMQQQRTDRCCNRQKKMHYLTVLWGKKRCIFKKASSWAQNGERKWE